MRFLVYTINNILYNWRAKSLPPHFNLIIIDMKKKVIERFEPYELKEVNWKLSAALQRFQKFLLKKKILKEFKYHNSKAISPKFPMKEEDFRKKVRLVKGLKIYMDIKHHGQYGF